MNCRIPIIAATISFSLVTGISAKEITVNVDGKAVKLQSTSLNHEIKESDLDKVSQANAMACSFLFYGLLTKGNIQGAAALSVDPVKTKEKWNWYQERVGADDFKKEMKEYFTTRKVVLAEVVFGEDILLVIKTEDGIMGQFYQKKNGKYWLTDAPASGKILGKVLNMIQEGKIKL